MNEIERIVTDIARLTSNIETNYPELYNFLDENPMTIPSEAHPYLDIKTLKQYLLDLEDLLRHHMRTHKTNGNDRI